MKPFIILVLALSSLTAMAKSRNAICQDAYKNFHEVVGEANILIKNGQLEDEKYLEQVEEAELGIIAACDGIADETREKLEEKAIEDLAQEKAL